MAGAIIIGVGPGIGAALARRCEAEGLAPVLVARRRESLEQAASGLKSADKVLVDTGAVDAVGSAIESARRRHGAPELLVYNAYASAPPVDELDPETLSWTLSVNVVGAFAAARAVLPAMIESGGGTILFTGGGLALQPSAQAAALSVGKAALRTLALVLADAWEPRGIHVATVTIRGLVQPGTAFDPDKIASRFWAVHRQPRGSWERESLFDG